MKKRLVIRGVADGYSSYGLHLLHVVKGLSDLGHFVNILRIPSADNGVQLPRFASESLVHKLQPEEGEMIIHCPSFAPAEKKAIIYNTMWETTRLDRARMLNLCNSEAVIVPSQWQAEVFSAQGLSKPIYIVPMGVDTDTFKYSPLKERNVFVFGAAGRTEGAGDRKRIPDVVKAFKEEFDGVDDVRLDIKCYPGDPEIAANDSRITFRSEFWDVNELAEWYDGIDAFVSASRGEGWGLMQHEAMAVGRTVIGTDFGGTSAFFDDSVGLTVDYKMVQSDEPYRNGGLWAEPNFEHVKARMREAYEGGSDVELKTLKGVSRAKEFSWKNSNKILESALIDFGLL